MPSHTRAGAVIVVLWSAAAAHAGNPLIGRAEVAVKAGHPAQAVADLRRAQASPIARKDDPEIARALDLATAAWLEQIAERYAAAPPLERLVALRRLLDEARTSKSATAITRITARRDATAVELLPSTEEGDLAARLAAARTIQAAGFPDRTWERVTKLEADVAAAADRVTGTDPFAGYARAQIRSYHGTGAPATLPTSPGPRWVLDVPSSTCDDIIASVRAALASESPDAVTARLTVTRCDLHEQRGSRREAMTWYRTEKVYRTVEGPTRRVAEWKRSPTSQRVCTPTYASSGYSDLRDGRVMVTPVKTGESCRTEQGSEDEMVTRDVTETRVVEETVRVPETENVDVSTRTSSLAVRVSGTLVLVGGRTLPFDAELGGTHEDSAYSSRHAGSRSFEDARAALRTTVAGQLRTRLHDAALPAVRAIRIATLENALTTATADERLRLLRALAMEQASASSDLVVAIAQQTGLSVIAVYEALRGERPAEQAAPPAVEVSLALPEPSAETEHELVVAEQRATIGTQSKGMTASSWIGFGRMSSANAEGWLANMDARLWAMPSKYLFRSRRAGAFFDLGGTLGVGRDTKAVLGGNLGAGAFAGLRSGGLSVDALALVGIDALKQYSGDGPPSPLGDPGAPGASYLGYGAILRAQVGDAALAVEVRRQHRNDGVVPELWVGELRASHGSRFFAARATAYEPLLDGASSRGTYVLSLQFGVWTAAQDLRPPR